MIESKKRAMLSPSKGEARSCPKVCSRYASNRWIHKSCFSLVPGAPKPNSSCLYVFFDSSRSCVASLMMSSIDCCPTFRRFDLTGENSTSDELKSIVRLVRRVRKEGGGRCVGVVVLGDMDDIYGQGRCRTQSGIETCAVKVTGRPDHCVYSTAQNSQQEPLLRLLLQEALPTDGRHRPVARRHGSVRPCAFCPRRHSPIDDHNERFVPDDTSPTDDHNERFLPARKFPLEEALAHYSGDDPMQGGLEFMDSFFGMGKKCSSLSRDMIVLPTQII